MASIDWNDPRQVLRPGGEGLTESLRTRAEIAAYLQKPVSWLRYKEARKEIPYVKLGQQVRYRMSDIQKWIDAHRQPAIVR